MINKNFDSKIPEKYEYDDIDMELIIKAKEAPDEILSNYNNLKIHKSIELIMQLLRSVNKYLEVKGPWKLIKSSNKEDKER